MKKILTLVKAHKIISGILVIVLAGGSYWLYQKTHAGSGSVQYVTEAVRKTTISVSVSATGQISAQNRIDLKPGGSGQSAAALTGVYVKQGDQVKAGQVIATVDQKNNNVALIQARASLANAQANYDKLVAGLTGTDLASAQLTLTTAQNNYDNTLTSQQQAVDKAYNTLLNSGLELVASNSFSTASITLSGTYTGTKETVYTVSTYDTSGAGLYYTVSGLDNGFESGPVNRGYTRPLGNGLYITFGSTGTLYGSSSWTINVPNKASSEYQTNLTAYNTALQNQKQNIESAKNSLTQAQLTYQSKTAPPLNTDLSQAKAQIAQAQAQLTTAEVNYSNNVIKSPFDGQVAQLNNQVGDQVTSSTIIATVITNQKMVILPLNEVDASKIQVGQKATLTFDALDGLSIAGTVAQIDTLGTVSQGVVSYNVKVGLDTQDDRVKPGMSVSAAIITNIKTDVLAVASSAIKSDANGTYVQILDSNKQPQNKSVQVGISNDTDTEIISGLNEGDMVVTQTITSSTTASSSTTTRTGTGGISIPGLGGGTGAGGAARFRGN